MKLCVQMPYNNRGAYIVDTDTKKYVHCSGEPLSGPPELQLANFLAGALIGSASLDGLLELLPRQGGSLKDTHEAIRQLRNQWLRARALGFTGPEEILVYLRNILTEKLTTMTQNV